MNNDEKEKLMESMIMKSMESIPRVCRMCGCDFIGFKLICDSKECAEAWRMHCQNLDRKFATNITKTPKAFLIFYPDYSDNSDEKK